MTDSIPHFIPLGSDSQSYAEQLLFYNQGASLEAIYSCATGRIQAVVDLLVNLHEYKTSDSSTLPAVSVVSTLLLNDACSLLEEFSPTRLEARMEQAEI